MLNIKTIDDINALKEDCEIECKLANGKDGDGQLPKAFWETYSAFANTNGGVVILGLKETENNSFTVIGIKKTDNVIQDLFNNLQNTDKVNLNIINDENITISEIDGKNMIIIEVPKAKWNQRPIYLRKNTVNTYKRLNEGDYKCSESEIRNMISESSTTPYDSQILTGFSIDDIDMESLKAYRQLMLNHKPTHPAHEQNTIDFLTTVGAWRIDRNTGNPGLTVAGLLMFGKLTSIQDYAPHYALDYIERPRAKVEERWTFRIYTDGSWSGNLFDFYRKVYKHLTEDIKIPFILEEGQRKEDSQINVALREALANTLCHANYRSDKSILIVKRPDMFGFRNPGNMRISIEEAKTGGHSDCRNPKIQQLFLHMGATERAGSGIPTIYKNWDDSGYRPPALYEDPTNETTLLELRLLDLLPTETQEELAILIPEFKKLSQLDKTILVTAKIEGYITHKRICEISQEHPRDITGAIQKLVAKDHLEKKCSTRPISYTLPNTEYMSADDFFKGESLPSQTSSGHSNPNPGHSDISSGHSDVSSGHNDASSGHNDKDVYGRTIHKDLNLPVVTDLNDLSAQFKKELEIICKSPRAKKRIKPEEMLKVLLNLCSGHYVTLPCIAQLTCRGADTIRKSYLTVLKEAGKLELAFPMEQTHPKQAYASVKEKV